MPQSASLPTYSAIYSFGDSLSDAGNLSITTSAAGATTPVSPPYFEQQYGLFSGNVFSNGPTWVQDLSIALGLGTLAPSQAGGTDFAYGGAETGSTPQNATDPKILSISLAAQLVAFQTQVLNPSANALYTVSSGSDDLLDILSTPGVSAQQQTIDVNDSVANEVSFLKSLVADGAKNLLVLDVPDLGKTPDVMTGTVNGTNVPSVALDTEASNLASSYNAALISQTGTIAGVHVVDAYSLIDDAIADPALYGVTNVTTPVWSGSYDSDSSGTLSSTSTAVQDQSLFWDHLHPTETGHQALADLAEQALSGVPVLSAEDTTTGQVLAAQGQPYTGPVSGLQQQYIKVTADSLNITATTPNWFLHSDAGEDALTVTGGTNVLDGGTGSNFLTGGSGTDTFFVDDRNATGSIWSTVVNFHAGDAATLWGVTQSDFELSWINGAGASGYTGLTLSATAAGKPDVLLTLASLTQADLTNGMLSISFGTDAASGSPYTYIHANA